MGRALSAAIARTSHDERVVVARNLRRVRGPARNRLARERDVQRVFDSYARYWIDVLRLPHLGADEVERGFTSEGAEHIEHAVASSTAPILALPHLGGWEWAARWLTLVCGHRVAAVVEPLEPPELYEWFLDFRRSLGMDIIPLGPSAGSEVAASLASGQIMCLLCDRAIGGGGVEVEFFGERTRLPGGPALMAMRSGAPLLPTAVYFRGRGCHAVVEPPLDTARRGRLRDDVARVTQDLATVLERQIRVAPEQWHLLQPNWPSDFEALGRPVPWEPDGAGPRRGGR